MEGILAGIKLTTAEYSKLRGCSERYVKAYVKKGRLKLKK